MGHDSTHVVVSIFAHFPALPLHLFMLHYLPILCERCLLLHSQCLSRPQNGYLKATMPGSSQLLR